LHNSGANRHLSPLDPHQLNLSDDQPVGL
jgi:hypothetical protein